MFNSSWFTLFFLFCQTLLFPILSLSHFIFYFFTFKCHVLKRDIVGMPLINDASKAFAFKVVPAFLKKENVYCSVFSLNYWNRIVKRKSILNKWKKDESKAFSENWEIGIWQYKWGHASQLLRLYSDWTSGKIWCLKEKCRMSPWRCFCGYTCQHALQKDEVMPGGKVQQPPAKLRDHLEEPWEAETSLETVSSILTPSLVTWR